MDFDFQHYHWLLAILSRCGKFFYLGCLVGASHQQIYRNSGWHCFGQRGQGHDEESIFFNGRGSAHTRHLTCSLSCSHAPLSLCQILTWFTLQGTRRNGNTMNNMKNMPNIWRRAGIWLPSPAALINRWVSLSTHSPPTHKEKAELRKVKLGNDSGFTADQWMAVDTALSHDISCTTCCCCPTVCSPKSPSSSASKPTATKQKLE